MTSFNPKPSSWWLAGLGCGGLFCERSVNSYVRYAELTPRNNQVRLDREKFHHQRRKDAANQQIQRVKETAKIYEAEAKGLYSPKVRDDLISQINSPDPIWSENMRVSSVKNDKKTQTKKTPPKLGSISLSNNDKKNNFNSNKTDTEYTGSEFFYNHEFQTIDDFPVFNIILWTIIGFFFGLFCRFLWGKACEYVDYYWPIK